MKHAVRPTFAFFSVLAAAVAARAAEPPITFDSQRGSPPADRRARRQGGPSAQCPARAPLAFSGGKTTVHEPGLRVPLVARDPYLPERDVPSYFQSLEHLPRYCARPPSRWNDCP